MRRNCWGSDAVAFSPVQSSGVKSSGIVVQGARGFSEPERHFSKLKSLRLLILFGDVQCCWVQFRLVH